MSKVDFKKDFVLLGVEGNRFLVGVGPFRDAVEPSAEIPSFFVQDFYFNSAFPWKIPEETVLISSDELRDITTQYVVAEFKQPDFKNYAALFDYINSEIAARRVVKAVPVTFEVAHSYTGDPRSLLTKIPFVPSFLHSYALSIGDQFVVGASPELLLRKDQESDLIFSEAIAGTTLTNDSERLLDDPHLTEEHRLVVEDIRDRLSSFGKVHLSPNSFQPYPGLMHLRAEVAVEVEGRASAMAMVNALHPTGALGVLPRMPLESDFIVKLDPQRCRGYYGAPLGVVMPNGYWKFVVMIRNVMFSGGQCLIGAGGGLLDGASLAKEWAELEAKRDSVKKLFL